MIEPAWLSLIPTVSATAAYTFGVVRLQRRGDSWPVLRTVYFFVGNSILAAALLPPLIDPATFPLHVVQHLMVAMAAPLALALSAPITLVLRALPSRRRRVLLAVLHSWVVRVLMWAPLILALDIGGMYAFYLTGLFELTEQSSWLHVAIHAHMFIAGCLFTWYLIARDPIRNRPSTVRAVLVLFSAAGCHDLLAKLMYANNLPSGHEATQIRLGAQIMFYGGDVIDVLLVSVILADWYRRTGREIAHHRRRAGQCPIPRPNGPYAPR